MDGKIVLLGNRRLISESGGDISALEPRTQLGSRSEGKTAVIVSLDGRVGGIVAVADTVKPSAKATVEALKGMGVQVVMLTGDNPRTAAAIAEEIGIDKFVAEALPAAEGGDDRVAAEGRDGWSRWWETASTTPLRWPRRTSG